MANRTLPFYNIDFAVGENQPNKRPDVLLVQFFLTKLANNDWRGAMVNRNFRRTPGPNILLEELKVDGLPSENLYNWIFWFQFAWTTRRGFGGLSFDGIVSPVPRELASIARPEQKYTLGLMNLLMENNFHHLFYTMGMPNNGFAPDELSAQLFDNKK